MRSKSGTSGEHSDESPEWAIGLEEMELHVERCECDKQCEDDSARLIRCRLWIRDHKERKDEKRTAF